MGNERAKEDMENEKSKRRYGKRKEQKEKPETSHIMTDKQNDGRTSRT